MTIQDLCKEEKERQNKTLKDVSDKSGLSINTVSNFFSNASKQPSFYTVAPICKALGVSLDSYCGISPSEQELQDKIDRLHDVMETGKEQSQKEIHNLELENIRLSEQNRIMQQTISRNRISSMILLLFNTVLTVALLVYLIIDANIRTEGLILHGQPTAMAYILMALAALSAVAVVIIAVRTVKKRK